MYDILTLNAMKVAELKSVAENLGVSNAEKLKKQDLVLTIMDRQTLSAAPADAPAKPPTVPTAPVFILVLNSSFVISPL